MRAAVCEMVGAPDVIKIKTIPVPTPQKGQVLIRVKVSVSETDPSSAFPILPFSTGFWHQSK